jgi:hypothetical protein
VITTYLVTALIDGNPYRTQDYAIRARSAWAAGWLYRQLHPMATLTCVRLAPEHRQEG